MGKSNIKIMKLKTKKLLAILSVLFLAAKSTPILASIIEIEILGGGYKLRGPSQISFTPVTTSTSDNSNFISFRNTNETEPNETNNFLKIIDENGGNPFDVTISAEEIKRHEPLITTTISGSTTDTIKVADTTGYYAGDNITIIDPNGGPELTNQTGGTVFTINQIIDINTIELVDTLNISPLAGFTFNRVVDCELNPRKCISLDNFSITNYDGYGDVKETINGNQNDLNTNSETDVYQTFNIEYETITGSNGNTLLLTNTGGFRVDETIKFPLESGVLPLTNTIISIEDENTITLRDAFTSAPGASIPVTLTTPRTFTLANGTGLQPGEWKIFPALQITIPAGQMPGSYETVLNLAIL